MLRAATVVVACSFTSDAVRARRAGNELTEVGDASRSLWSTYVANANAKAEKDGRGLQEACEPKLYDHQGDYRGVAMLFHGFTACPQQFEVLIPQLTARGFAVFTPLHPGHGYNYLATPGSEYPNKDYIADLPTHEEEWRAFGDEMHAIMQSAGGEKAIFGLSVGGGVAGYVGGLGGYDRQFLAAPMILPDGFAHQIIMLNNRYPWRRHQVVSWGEGCENERAHGRAGICQFTAAIGSAAKNLGQQYSGNGSTIDAGSIQLLFVEDDPAVSTNAIINMGIRKFGMTKTSTNICGMDAAIGHSFLSTYDNVGTNMYWLNEAVKMITDYLVDGTTLPQGGGTQLFGTEEWPRCNIRATP